ncbi:P1 family peptidase [Thermoanaerobacterium sp. DL9XJH110]|uniref:P1 family peptidase n=1 Tax=Thermoanaerobacterium sp. DL9XJH110 TaxID=3386643 RepID=UPI003BB6A35F
MLDCITDVKGIKVGHAQDLDAATGCTVVLCEEGAVGGAEVRGGAPGTRETDLLGPRNLVEKVHGVYLSGGSAFGLDGASGVMRYLEERGIGFDVGVTKVPIVPAAVLFDLTVGDYRKRPDFAMGYEACLNATDNNDMMGNVGAGTGATVGKFLGDEFSMKGGLGTASIRVGDLVVGALVAVNCLGDVIDPDTGEIVAGALNETKTGFADTMKLMKAGVTGPGGFGRNTTIGVVATNAALTKAGAGKVASMAHNGYARTIRPVHTMYDGDTVFCLSCGRVRAEVSIVGALAAEVVAKAVVRAVRSAETLGGKISHKDLKKL